MLQLLGADWKHTGGIGTAKVVKLVNNMMSMGNVLVAAEAFALGVAAGVEPQKLYDVLSVSGGRSHHFTKRFPNALKGDFSPGFKMELGEKDLALAVELGRTMKMPTPSASIVARSLRPGAGRRLSRPGHRGVAVDVSKLDPAFEITPSRPAIIRLSLHPRRKRACNRLK